MLGYGPIAAQPIGAEATGLTVLPTPVPLMINCTPARLSLGANPVSISYGGPVVPGPSNVYTINVGATGSFAVDFTPKRPEEIELYGVDFSDLIALRAPGVTIKTATWRNSTVFGTDPNPNAMFLGPAIVSGNVVVVWIGGGLAGCGYRPVCDVVLTDHEVLALPEPKNGLLEVYA